MDREDKRTYFFAGERRDDRGVSFVGEIIKKKLMDRDVVEY